MSIIYKCYFIFLNALTLFNAYVSYLIDQVHGSVFYYVAFILSTVGYMYTQYLFILI